MRFERLKEIVSDFFDADDSRLLDGMEHPEYLRAGKPFFPKNRDLEFREELFGIPGFSEFFPVELFQVIPPEKTDPPGQMVSIYSSDLDTISLEADLTDQEKEDFSAGLDKWKREQIPLSKSLKASLRKKLEKLSNKESGCYRIHVFPGKNGLGIALDAVFRPSSETVYDIEFLEYYTR